LGKFFLLVRKILERNNRRFYASGKIFTNQARHDLNIYAKTT